MQEFVIGRLYANNGDDERALRYEVANLPPEWKRNRVKLTLTFSVITGAKPTSGAGGGVIVYPARYRQNVGQGRQPRLDPSAEFCTVTEILANVSAGRDNNFSVNMDGFDSLFISNTTDGDLVDVQLEVEVIATPTVGVRE